MTRRLVCTELRGDGLLLRPWDPASDADAEAMLTGVTDPEFKLWNNPAKPIEDLAGAREALRNRARQWDEGVAGSYCVTDEVTGRILGSISLISVYWPNRNGTIGYWVLPDARGKRVATRSLGLLADWAFGLGVHRLALDHVVANEASCRVAERCGFVGEGILRGSHLNADGTFSNAHMHARLATDRPATPATSTTPADKA